MFTVLEDTFDKCFDEIEISKEFKSEVVKTEPSVEQQPEDFGKLNSGYFDEIIIGGGFRSEPLHTGSVLVEQSEKINFKNHLISKLCILK